MFQFTGFASTRLWIQRRNIRESRDQRSFVNSPRLIADFHALHRLLMPRHPPCALNSLTTNIHCSQTFASPLQALRSFFHFAPTKPGRWPSPVEHSSEDAIYARKTKLSKIKCRLLSSPRWPCDQKRPRRERQNLVIRPPVVNGHRAFFSFFFKTEKKRLETPFYRQPRSQSLTAACGRFYRRGQGRQGAAGKIFAKPLRSGASHVFTDWPAPTPSGTPCVHNGPQPVRSSPAARPSPNPNDSQLGTQRPPKEQSQ